MLGRLANERELNSFYNAAVFFSRKRAGARTSLIVDPPNGRIPPLTPEAQKAVAAEREFRLTLLLSDRYVQEQVGCLCGRQIRSDALTAIRGSPASLQHREQNSSRGPEEGALSGVNLIARPDEDRRQA